MSSAAFRLCAITFLSLCIAIPVADAQRRPYRGNVYENAQYGYELRVPPGYVICVGPRDAPASYGIEIPLHKTTKCDGTSLVAVSARFDAAESYGDLDQRAADECRGRGDPDPDPRFVIQRAGNLLGGLETVVCTRVDVSFGEYTKKVMARSKAAETPPIDYTIAVYADLKDRSEADSLLSQTVSGFAIKR